MELEFICLFRLGVGPVLVRYGDISLIEPTALNCTRIDLAYGGHIIVAEDITCVLGKIQAIQLLNQQNNQQNNPE